MENKNAHVVKMEKRLEKWSDEMNEFVANGDEIETDARIEYIKRISKVKLQYKIVRTKLDELSAAGDKEWSTVKSGVENAWNELEVAYEKLTT